ncbi:TPA: hypothetical protein ACN1ND_000287 [Enterococcus faecalis]|nr:hypothetical protein [Enterococcus faecalis]
MQNSASNYDNELLVKKRKIRQLRKELYSLMAIDDNWFKNEDSSLYKEIISCGQKLRQIECPNMNISINELEYKKLRSLGFTLKEIANHFCISSTKLNRWRHLKHIED